MSDVALFVPCYIDQFYPRVGVSAASVLIAFVAGGWFVERSLDLRLMPF